MDISVHTGEHLSEDRSWLGSAHGTDATQTVTLDISAFDAEDNYPNGFIPSGTVLAKIAATGLYGPYATGGAGGLEVAVGFLFNSTKVPADGTTDVGAPILLHGRIVEANLPDNSGLDSDARTALAGRVIFA